MVRARRGRPAPARSARVLRANGIVPLARRPPWRRCCRRARSCCPRCRPFPSSALPRARRIDYSPGSPPPWRTSSLSPGSSPRALRRPLDRAAARPAIRPLIPPLPVSAAALNIAGEAVVEPPALSCNALQRRRVREDKDRTNHGGRWCAGTSRGHGTRARRVPLPQPTRREYTACRLRSPLRLPGHPGPRKRPASVPASSPLTPRSHWGAFAAREDKRRVAALPRRVCPPFRPPVGETEVKGERAPLSATHCRRRVGRLPRRAGRDALQSVKTNHWPNHRPKTREIRSLFRPDRCNEKAIDKT
jgi:hypothetical protein